MKAPSHAPRRWAWHQRALLGIRDTLLQERKELSRAIRLPLEHGGEDVADVASDKSEINLLLAEIEHEDSLLAEVNAAIGRLRDGTYDRCQITGRPISAARLRAIPWTRFSHQAALQQNAALPR